ncbi:MAG TPA: saccharopine dehydrogenase NADP-binding domain-containing protein [Thermoanaerobaculia bacterium]
MTVTVFGGYGTFGAHAARALAKAGAKVRIAGRNEARAKGFAASLGAGHEGIAADAADPASCARALAGARVAVNCAGPFSALPLTLPEACLAAGAHSVDIADDRSWLTRLRALDGRFRDRGLTAACGCSSLPGISGALALLAAELLPAVHRARVTLFIGNRNPKGDAAVRSAAAQLGKTFSSPEGPLVGLRGRETVRLPEPFGARAVYDWNSPELDLFPGLLGAREVRVKVGFESRLATHAFATLARLGPPGSRLVPPLAVLGRALSGFGHSGGCVQVELFAPDGTTATASLGGPEDGQRMAALPAAFVALGLLDGTVTARGVVTAFEALGAQGLIEGLVVEGYTWGQSPPV